MHLSNPGYPTGAVHVSRAKVLNISGFGSCFVASLGLFNAAAGHRLAAEATNSGGSRPAAYHQLFVKYYLQIPWRG